jgi:hypothetical protein
VAKAAGRFNRLLFLVCHRCLFREAPALGKRHGFRLGFGPSRGRSKPAGFLDYPMAKFHPLNRMGTDTYLSGYPTNQELTKDQVALRVCELYSFP